MRIVKQLTNGKFLNIKEVRDPENHVNGYQFAERKGKDSVAFILWDNDHEQFLLNNEYKPPVDEFILGAFGGSLDKDKTPEQIVIEEVKEEAGFVVSKDQVHFVGEVFVSTQMNQFCRLYLVEVNKEYQDEREPENAIEAMAETKWIQFDSSEFAKLRDWKALTIISLAQTKNILPS
jgi:8-oxo-dGTP pyrophosphatase MutT (NUDIX family)